MLRFIKLRLRDDSGIARLSVDHITCYSEQGDSTRVITAPSVSTYVKETSEEIDKLIADAATGNATDMVGELLRLSRDGMLDFLKT